MTNYFSFKKLLILFFFSLIFNSGFLNFDALRAYNEANNLIYNIIENQNNKLVISNLPWVLHNAFFIFISSIINLFLDETLNPFIIKYFINFLHSFYTCLAFYIFYIFANSKLHNKLASLFFSIIVFFGTGLIIFFTSAYIENIVILLFILRQVINSKLIIIIIDIFICLIKPYYLLFIFYYIFFCEFRIFKTFLTQFLYFFFLVFLIIINSFYLNVFFNYIEPSSFNFDLINIVINLRDIFFSSSSGILNTMPFILVFVILGYEKKTFYKLLFTLIFFIFLSLFNFWYAHLPMSGRYILSIIPFFLPEILRGFQFLLYLNNKYFKFFLFFLIILNNFINLPTINIKNTSYVHYSMNAAKYEKFDKMTLKKYIHPINESKFHQYYFNYFYYKALILNKKNFIFQDKVIEIKNIYPALGILRIKYVIKNFDNLKNNTMLNYEILLKISKIPLFFAIIIDIFLIFFIFFYLILNFFFLFKFINKY